MKRIVVLLLVIGPMLGAAQNVPGEGPIGDWLGNLDVGVVRLRLALHVERGANGTLRATLNSVDQNATLPVDSISFRDGMLSFSIARVGGSFEGIANADGSSIIGTWMQAGQNRPLTFNRLSEPFALKRPQTPEPPFPYRETSVSVRNDQQGITLACTVLVPDGDGPFPAVVFLSGSGAQDRNESLAGHQPFLVIADYLGRRGLASMRCDDRGVGGSGGSVFQSTEEDLRGDVNALVAALGTQRKVNAENIGLLGHSEGALLAPMVAAGNPDVSFLVLLAPPGEPMDELLLQQNRDFLEAQGVDPSLISRAVATTAEDLALVKDQSLSPSALDQKLHERVAVWHARFTASELEQLHVMDATIQQGIQQVSTPWFRSLVHVDPSVALRQVKVPVLALFGGKDLQVTPKTNAPPLEAALRAAPTDDVTVRTLPGLNHLFQHAGTGLPNEYGTIEETIAHEALQLIAQWLAARVDTSSEPSGL